MKHADALISILHRNPEKMRILAFVRALQLPDCWVGAGFVRNAVWDALGTRTALPVASGDVDVIWFDSGNCGSEIDARLERKLVRLDSGVRWSVKNQSRMHGRNGDAPYQSATDAMRYWPETATAVAARCTESGRIELAAPFGLDDLFNGIIRPTPRFATGKRAVFDLRCREKKWLEQWPFLRIA
jgi:hypothetical protein